MGNDRTTSAGHQPLPRRAAAAAVDRQQTKERRMTAASRVSSWEQHEVFLIIERLIDAACVGHTNYISEKRVAARLRRDPDARRLLRQAQKKRPQRSVPITASNMAAW